jgi:type IV pilus assembly protein PilC
MAKHRFVWRGVDRKGEIQSGVLDAHTQEEVSQELKQQRIRATRIQRQFNLPNWLQLNTPPRVSTRDITQFTRQLATLLHAGVPLQQAFDILDRGESNAALKTLIRELRTQVEGGVALNQALRQHAAFDPLYCNLVAVGELAGMLDSMLERLANHLEKSEALRTTIRSALIYPSAVLTIAGLVLVLILVFVVPAFQNIFASFGAELPWLTQAVIALSEGLQRYGLWLLTLTGLSAWGLKQLIARRTDWQRYLHRLLLRIPIAGPLTRHACTARWTRTLATLFAAGVPLTEALEAVEGVTNHLLFQAATHNIQAQLIQGKSLSHALESTDGLFPPMVVQMCAIGEESGALDHMLEKTAEHYEHEVDSTVARLSTLLEPFIMVVLGLLIGGLVMALYLPIFQLGQVV